MTDNKEPVSKYKIHLQDGDIVECSKISSPRMVVKELCRKQDTIHKEKSLFIGIKCYWFTTDWVYQEAVFHREDLTKIEEHDRL